MRCAPPITRDCGHIGACPEKATYVRLHLLSAVALYHQVRSVGRRDPLTSQRIFAAYPSACACAAARPPAALTVRGSTRHRARSTPQYRPLSDAGQRRRRLAPPRRAPAQCRTSARTRTARAAPPPPPGRSTAWPMRTVYLSHIRTHTHTLRGCLARAEARRECDALCVTSEEVRPRSAIPFH